MADPPAEIDNSCLLQGKNLRRNISERSDYTLLHELQWRLLHGWYGGGPVIARKVIRVGGYYNASLQVEVHLLNVLLVKSSDLQTTVSEVLPFVTICVYL
tara:strand:+ start:959 stop:1258 length:300 start_codon:yes stop_codon:yes gene_type:complete